MTLPPRALGRRVAARLLPATTGQDSLNNSVKPFPAAQNLSPTARANCPRQGKPRGRIRGSIGCVGASYVPARIGVTDLHRPPARTACSLARTRAWTNPVQHPNRRPDRRVANASAKRHGRGCAFITAPSMSRAAADPRPLARSISFLPRHSSGVARWSRRCTNGFPRYRW